MQAHKVREMENEKVFERKMVKEAEEEAHLYGDKERFLTSAYRAKIAAREEYEKGLAKQDAEDTKNDVTKKGDLTGFYSNLLLSTLAPDRAATTADADTADAAQPPPLEGSGAKPVCATASVPSAPPAAANGLIDADLAGAIAAAAAASKERPAAAPAPAPATLSYDRRNDAGAVQSARDRYLERKRQRTG